MKRSIQCLLVYYLSNLHIDRFIVPDDSIYDSVRTMRAYISAVEEEGDALVQP